MKKGIIKSLSIVAFIISAIFTIKLMTSGSSGIVNTLLVAGMGVVLELSKCLFGLAGFTNVVTSNKTLKSICIGVSVLLVMFSIIASLSFMQNQTNTIKNKDFKKSEGYQQQVTAKETASKMMDSTSIEIKRLQDESKSEIAKLEAQRDEAKKRNWISTSGVGVNAINDKISATRNKYNDLIEKQNVKLEGYSNRASSNIDASKVNVKSNKGYTAFLETIAGWISTEDAPVTSELLELILFSVISITFEVVAVLLFVLGKESESLTGAEVYNDSNKNNIDIGADAEPNLRGKEVMPLKKNCAIGFNQEGQSPNDNIREKIIGFKPYDNNIKSNNIKNDNTLEPSSREVNIIEKYCVDRQTVLNYLEKAEESKKIKNNNDEISGLQALSKECSIPENTARNVFGYLKHLGIIEVRGRSSFLIKEPSEYNKILGL
jgi:hypothetical protein